MNAPGSIANIRVTVLVVQATKVNHIQEHAFSTIGVNDNGPNFNLSEGGKSEDEVIFMNFTNNDNETKDEQNDDANVTLTSEDLEHLSLHPAVEGLPPGKDPIPSVSEEAKPPVHNVTDKTNVTRDSLAEILDDTKNNQSPKGSTTPSTTNRKSDKDPTLSDLSNATYDPVDFKFSSSEELLVPHKEMQSEREPFAICIVI